jgi:hypothetical protein
LSTNARTSCGLSRPSASGAELELLEADGLLVRGGGAGRVELADVGRGRGVALALAADRPRLALDHGLEPRQQVLRVGGGRLGEHDLEPALERILGVLGSLGPVAGAGHHLLAMAPDHLPRERVDLAPRRRRPQLARGVGGVGGRHPFGSSDTRRGGRKKLAPLRRKSSASGGSSSPGRGGQLQLTTPSRFE